MAIANYVEALLIGFCAIFLGLFSLLGAEKLAYGWRYGLDLPTARSMHQVPIPRIGGITLFIAFIGLTWALELVVVNGLFYAVLLLVTVCFLDDLGIVGFPEKLAAQMIFVGILMAPELGSNGFLDLVFFYSSCG